jgi:transposase
VRTIREKNPDQLRLPFALWTREAVRDLVERRFGVRLAIRTVGDYLRRWGFTPQKPVQRAYERNPAAVTRWLERDYPALRARAKREGAMILWGDEMGLRSDHARGRSYSPRGETPVVGKAGRRFGCNVIQAVGNRGELWFRVFDGRFSQDVFIDFLRRLLKTADGHKLILVVDGHPGHRGKKARAFIDARADLLEVVYLPGYSPDLNPAEYLNNDTKHGVLKTRPATPDSLISAARRHLHRRQKQPTVVKNFFRHPAVAYAA